MMDETKSNTQFMIMRTASKLGGHIISLVFVGFTYFILKIPRLSKPTNCVLTRLSNSPFRFPVCV